MATLNGMQVFADPSGRRGRAIRACGLLAALAAVGFLIAVAVVLTAAPKSPQVSKKKAWMTQENLVVAALVRSRPASSQSSAKPMVALVPDGRAQVSRARL